MLAWSTVALAAAPAVTVEWKKDHASLVVTPPQGAEIGPEAPARLALDWGTAELDLAAPGAVLHQPVTVADLRGTSVRGHLDLALCAVDGTTCTPTSWVLSGAVPDQPKGAVSLVVATAEAEGEARPFGPSATTDAADAAFARAKQSGKPVLLDFSAVWCPPCNELAAEVLHADPPPPELEGYEVAVLDADHRATFPLKERYHVGGYPTVLVVDAEGREKTRMVGYGGKEALLAWLAGAPSSSDAADLAAGPGAASPTRAAELAWQLASAGRAEDAKPWLERARSQGADTAELHLASLALAGTAADAAWIVEHAPAHALDAAEAWRGSVDPKDQEADRALLDLAAPIAKGTEQADVLEMRAELLPDGPEKQALYAGAAAVVTASLTGDPARDKGLWEWLAELHEQAGHPERAVAVLQAAQRAWPDEPTFDLALSPLLLRTDRPEEALEAAKRAVDHSWDDNRLRAVAAESRALSALGRTDEAKAVAAAELAAQPAPAPGENPRTERYRAKLQELADGAPAAGG